VKEKWTPGALTTKIESAEKKVLSFIASYIVSYLTYNKTFYIFIKCMKRRFFFMYQNSVNTGHKTRLGLKNKLTGIFQNNIHFLRCALQVKGLIDPKKWHPKF